MHKEKLPTTMRHHCTRTISEVPAWSMDIISCCRKAWDPLNEWHSSDPPKKSLERRITQILKAPGREQLQQTWCVFLINELSHTNEGCTSCTQRWSPDTGPANRNWWQDIRHGSIQIGNHPLEKKQAERVRSYFQQGTQPPKQSRVQLYSQKSKWDPENSE